MRTLGSLLMLAVAGTVAALTIGSALLGLAGVFLVPGWWGLVALAFPAFMAFAVWRGWGDGPPYYF